MVQEIMSWHCHTPFVQSLMYLLITSASALMIMITDHVKVKIINVISDKIFANCFTIIQEYVTWCEFFFKYPPFNLKRTRNTDIFGGQTEAASIKISDKIHDMVLIESAWVCGSYRHIT